MSANNSTTIHEVTNCSAFRVRGNISVSYTKYSKRVYHRKPNNKTPICSWVEGTVWNAETNETCFDWVSCTVCRLQALYFAEVCLTGMNASNVGCANRFSTSNPSIRNRLSHSSTLLLPFSSETITETIKKLDIQLEKAGEMEKSGTNAKTTTHDLDSGKNRKKGKSVS